MWLNAKRLARYIRTGPEQDISAVCAEQCGTQVSTKVVSPKANLEKDNQVSCQSQGESVAPRVGLKIIFKFQHAEDYHIPTSWRRPNSLYDFQIPTSWRRPTR